MTISMNKYGLPIMAVNIQQFPATAKSTGLVFPAGGIWEPQKMT